MSCKVRDVRFGAQVMLTGNFGGGTRLPSTSRDTLSKAATATARYSRENSIGKLAKFFPDVTPLRIPVRVTRVAKGAASSESTLIEFGTSREVLFASSLPLEFADMLRLQNSDGTLDTEACVVALQYNGERTAVAARFKESVANWIVKQ